MCTPISFSEQFLTSQLYVDYCKPIDSEISRIAITALLVIPIIAPAGAVWNALNAAYYFVRRDAEKTKQFAKAAFVDLQVSTAAIVCYTLRSRTGLMVASLVSADALASLTNKPPIPKVLLADPSPSGLSVAGLFDSATPYEPLFASPPEQLAGPTLRGFKLEDRFDAAGFELYSAIFTCALLYLVDSPNINVLEGRQIAAQLKTLSNQEPHAFQLAERIEAYQSGFDYLLARCNKQLNWDITSYGNLYNLLPDFRDHYAKMIANFELQLLLCAKKINGIHESRAFPDGTAPEPLSYDSLREGKDISSEISSIVKYHQRLPELKALRDEAEKLQRTIRRYREADHYLMTIETYPREQEVESKIRKAQPASFLDIPLAIKNYQTQIAILAFNANTVISHIKLDTSLSEEVRNKINPVAFAYPLNPLAIAGELKSYAGLAEIYADLNSLSLELAKLGETLHLLQFLNQNYPDPYVDQQTYRSLFFGKVD